MSTASSQTSLAKRSIKDLRVDINAAQSFDGQAILVRVGTACVEFWVHKTLLCSGSEFFRNMLSGSWKEANSSTVTLPDDSPAAFRVYTHYLYTNKIATMTTKPILEEVSDESKSSDQSLEGQHSRLESLDEFDILARSYILGEKIQHSEFRDAVIDALIHLTIVENLYPAEEFARLAYNNTLPGSPLRRLVIDQYCWYGIGKWITGLSAEKHDKEFLYDLSAALLDRRDFPDDEGIPYCIDDTCAYHVHSSSGEICYKENKRHL